MSNIDPIALYTISSGLYVLTANDNRDNGCIINTTMQITNQPNALIIGVNKANFTHDMIVKSGKFNVSALCADATFDLVKRFGFQSGMDVDKFAGFESAARAENGVLYLTEYTCAYYSADVTQAMDMGTHTVFCGLITHSETLSKAGALTYAYYQSHVKPRPQPIEKHGWRCNICGYVYEGDPLPPDFICPICKHGAGDFTRI